MPLITPSFRAMLQRFYTNKYLPLVLFLLAWTIYLANSKNVSIYILDEAKNAECAREMLEKSDFIVPTFNYQLRTDKPPLHYFFMMLSYSVFGVNPFAARFFSAFFGAATLLVSYLFARKFASPAAAFYTAMVFLASVHLSIQFHLAVPDPYLVFFMTASLISFYSFLATRQSRYQLALYASMGLGVLSKGPIAIALPGLIFLLYLIFSKQCNWKTIASLRPFFGAFLVLAIALPWYVLVHMKTDGAWTEGFFLKHNLGRFTDEMEGHGGTFLATILFVLVGLFPFSVLLPQAIGSAFRERKNQFVLFNLIAGLCIVGFFMLSKTRLPNYTVPALPFLAILLGIFINQNRKRKSQFKPALGVLWGISVLLVPAVIWALKIDPALSSINSIGWYFLPFPILITTALVLYWRQKTTASLGAIALGGITVSLVFFGLAFPAIDAQNPVNKSASMLANKELRYFRKFNAAFSFEHQKEIPEIQADEFSLFFDRHPDGAVISTEKKISDLDLPDELEVSFRARDVFESPTTVIITRKTN